MDEKDRQFSRVIKTFIDCMRLADGDPRFQENGQQFNSAYDKFAETYDDMSIGALALGLSKLGLPYDVALRDIVYIRGFGLE